MSVRTTLVLLALLALLLAYLRFGPPGESSPSPSPQPPLFRLDPENVVALEVQTESGRAKLLRTSPDGPWQLEDGREADQFRVTSLIGRMSSPVPRRSLGPVAELAPFGLEPPRARVTISLQDGTATVLLFGDSTPDGTGRYMQLASSSEVVVVDSALADGLFRLVTEPPLAPTPTPSPTETPAPSP